MSTDVFVNSQGSIHVIDRSPINVAHTTFIHSNYTFTNMVGSNNINIKTQCRPISHGYRYYINYYEHRIEIGYCTGNAFSDVKACQT